MKCNSSLPLYFRTGSGQLPHCLSGKGHLSQQSSCGRRCLNRYVINRNSFLPCSVQHLWLGHRKQQCHTARIIFL